MSFSENAQTVTQETGSGINKFVVGFAVTAAFALAGVTGGIAGATNGNSQQNGNVPQSKEACKNGGFRNFGFKNQGQCIKAVNQQNNGYGGNGGNNVGFGFNVNGDNNIVNVVIRFLFG